MVYYQILFERMVLLIIETVENQFTLPLTEEHAGVFSFSKFPNTIAVQKYPQYVVNLLAAILDGIRSSNKSCEQNGDKNKLLADI